MFPKHETAFIHCKGRAVINLEVDLTLQDLVDSYGQKAMPLAK